MPDGSTFSYDVKNRVVSNGAIYDPRNRRVWDGSSLYLYATDGKLVGIYTPSLGATSYTTRVRYNVWFEGKLIRQDNKWVMTDRLGSVRANGNGERFNYYPYGQEMTPTSDHRTKFGTYWQDSPGLDYADQRYYANGAGSFLTADRTPASNALVLTLNWNRYAYVGGDPINKGDPAGLCSPDDNPPCFSATGTATGDGQNVPGSNTGKALPALPPDPDQQPASGSGPNPSAGCKKLVPNSGFAGLTYDNALRIWNDIGLEKSELQSGYAATLAALAAVTWQGESSFQTNPINNPNRNSAGTITSVDYGPFQINQFFHPSDDASVWGTSGAGQPFNGDVDANIAYGISILADLYSQFGNTAAGHYVGSLGNDNAGNPINPNAQARQATWNRWGAALTGLFSNKECFK
jgi:RHS repeat-associated protein